MSDAVTIPESVLLCIMFGAVLLALTTGIAGYYFGRWKEGKEWLR